MRMMLLSRTAVLAALVSGCATTTTKLAPITPEEVSAEELKQRELALVTLESQQARLDRLSYPILAAAVPLCGAETRGGAGFRYASLHSFEKEWRQAAANAFGMNDSVQVVAVTPGSPADRAGLRAGDRILALNAEPTVPGEVDLDALVRMFEQVSTGGMRSMILEIGRAGDPQQIQVNMETVCSYPARVVSDGALNAYADGEAIYITNSMMRFAEDDELRAIIGHELAHNAMGHIKAQKKNVLLGALLGALGDVAMASAGYNSGGYYAAQGAQLGAMSFSQDFEREADYVGLYALALAGYDLASAPTLWRHMAQANPETIGLAFSHPTSAERFVRMEKAIQEIEAKRVAGQPLQPEMKD